MHKALFGKLIQSLRKEHRDEDGILWTQETLARKSGVDKRMIERLEQGLLRKLDPDMLLRLADALELTTAERKEFFFAALSLDNRNLTSPKSNPNETLNTVLRMLESIKLPAIILDDYADVIAVNSAVVYLFDIYDDLIKYPSTEPAAYNMMRVTFSRESKYRGTLNEEWTRSAQHNIRIFRGLTLRYRFHPYFQQLLAALRKHPTFRLYWEQAHLEEEDSTTNSLIYEYTHPKFGPIQYMANASNSVTRWGGLHWAIYIPMNQRTTSVFQNIIQHYGTDVILLAPWPKE